jgi:phosphoglycerate dehydrogenase-like enzyme
MSVGDEVKTPLESCVVLVTPRSFGHAAPELRTELEVSVGTVRYSNSGRPLTAEELAGQMADVDGLLAGLDEIDSGVFASAPHLRVVARYGVGVDNVDLVAAHTHHVVVTNTPGANSQAVAELTIGLIFSLARSIPQSSWETRSGAWRSQGGIEVAGRTVGLIGLGRVGRVVAARARAVGCRVTAYDPYVDPGQVAEKVEMTNLENVARSSDFISLHVPLTAETAGMVSGDFLDMVRPGAYLINTARGGLIVEQDLLHALESGVISGSALDTMATEPPDPENPLLQHPRVIVTPHSGAHTAEAATAMGRAALDDLLAVLSGREPRHPVDLVPENQHAAV